MNIHEYQAKQVLKGYGAPVAAGVRVASVIVVVGHWVAP